MIHHEGTKNTKVYVEALSFQVIGAAIEVHRRLGPGLLESAYESCLCRELMYRGVEAERQIPLPLIYRGEKIDCGYRIDLIVEDLIIVETKSVTKVLPIHRAQMLTYLKLTDKHLGLLLNFNSIVLRTGIHRILND